MVSRNFFEINGVSFIDMDKSHPRIVPANKVFCLSIVSFIGRIRISISEIFREIQKEFATSFEFFMVAALSRLRNLICQFYFLFFVAFCLDDEKKSQNNRQPFGWCSFISALCQVFRSKPHYITMSVTFYVIPTSCSQAMPNCSFNDFPTYERQKRDTIQYNTI